MAKFTAIYRKNQSLWDSVLRLTILPLSGICALFQSYLIISRAGQDVFAAVSILWSVVLLVPFADLGLGAIITNTVARSRNPRTDPLVRARIVSAIRLLVLSGVILASVGLVIGTTKIWSRLDPVVASKSINMDTATIILAIFLGIGLPLSIWQRILLGLGRNWLVILLQAIAAPVALICVWIFLETGLMDYIGSAPAIAALATASLGCAYLLSSSKIGTSKLLSAAFDTKRVPQVKLASVAAPMLVILVVQPLALQTDRLILGWNAPPNVLPEYSVVAQLYLPALAVLSAGAASMWPRFAKVSHDPMLTRNLFRRETLILTGLATVLCIGLVVAGPAIVSVVSDGVIAPGRQVYAAFGMLLVVQALAMPAAMMMTDASGLKFQAIAISIVMCVKLSVTLLYADNSAEGPVLVSAFVIFFGQFVPSFFYLWRTRMRVIMRDVSW